VVFGVKFDSSETSFSLESLDGNGTQEHNLDYLIRKNNNSQTSTIKLTKNNMLDKNRPRVIYSDIIPEPPKK
jgi:hypothetical protein